MSFKNTKKSHGITGALFNCTGEMRMDNFSCLNSSISLFCFYFVTNLRRKKKKKAYVRLQLSLPPSPIRASTLLAGPPLPLRAYVPYG